MKKKRNFIPYILALLFCFLFTFVLDLIGGRDPFTMRNVIFGLSNALTGACIILLFEKIISDNAKRPVNQLKKRLIPSFIFFVIALAIIAFVFLELGLYVIFLHEGYSTGEFLSQIFHMKYTGPVISLASGILIV